MGKLLCRPRTIIFFLAALFLFTRLYNLTLLPIFTDEAIYIYWAKYIATFHSHFFMSLTDGKPPLFIWFIVVFLKLFPATWYLVAGRFVSIIAGAGTIVGVYKLADLLFSSKKIAYLAAFFSLVNPFMLLYDRLALYDSLLSAFLLWSAYFAIKTASTLSKKDAILWGLFLGFGLLTKPPAIIFVFLTPLCFFLFLWNKNWKQQLKKKALVVIIAVFIAELLNNIQRLSFSYQLMTAKNEKFQLPVSELFSAPVSIIRENLYVLFSWIISYYTIPVFIGGFAALLYLFYKDVRKGLVLFILWIVPILVFATVGKILFPRYILFTTPYFLIATSVLLYQVKAIKVRIAICIVLFFLSVQFDYFLLTNPTKAPLPLVDYHQYITSEYSGYGLDQVFAFFDEELDRGPRITLVTEGKFGLFPYAFNLRYWNDPRMTIIPSWIPEKKDFDLYAFAKSTNVFAVFSRQTAIPISFPLRLVSKITKPGNEHVILVTALENK